MNDFVSKMGMTLDISKTIDAASVVKAQIDEMNEERWRQAQAVSNENRKMLQAMEETAANTAESKEQLQKIVAQQIKYEPETWCDDAEGKRLRYEAYARRFLDRIDKAA